MPGAERKSVPGADWAFQGETGMAAEIVIVASCRAVEAEYEYDHDDEHDQDGLAFAGRCPPSVVSSGPNGGLLDSALV